jgi:hypothetical protein
MPTRISAANIQPGAITADRLAEGVGGGPKITNVQVTDSGYNVIDDTAVGLSGGYLRITGTGFQSGCVAIVGNTPAAATSFISSSFLNVQVGAAPAGTYILYVVNPDGGVAIRVNAVTYSQIPVWITGSTLPEIGVDDQISIQLSAAGDSPVAYRLLAEFTLPPGLSLSSSGLLSGSVTGLENDTLYSFTVIAEDTENQDSPRTFSITVVVGDPFFNSTVLLLNGDGANSAQNNTFLDSSANNFTITRNGNPTQGTFSPFSSPDGRWSNYFDGSGDFLSVTDNGALDFGTGDFTIESWIHPTTALNVSSLTICDSRAATDASTGNFLLFIATTTKLRFVHTLSTGDTVYESNSSIMPFRWTHVAVTRSGDTLKMFIDGILENTSTVTGKSFNTVLFNIGYKTFTASGVTYWNGYLSNFRILKGTAVYTSNFTPLTSPLTAITNTSLLTCQSNRFKDNSTNNFTITPSGDARVTSFAPFAPAGVYSAATNGGGGYFDGTGDYLSIPASTVFAVGTQNFCFECWYYPISKVTAFPRIAQSGLTSWGTNDNWALLCRHNDASTKFSWACYALGVNAQLLTSTTTVQNNTWYHLAVTREGSTFRLFVNGILESTYTNSGAVTASSTVGCYIGGINASDATDNGMVSSARYVVGSSVYTSSFTPPTAPLSAIANTQLLCNFTNAAIIDNTGKNVLETVGNAQISTAEKKFGTGSLGFDGSGDYLTMRSVPDLTFGTGNFTLESWINIASPNDSPIYESRTGYTNATDGFTLTAFSSTTIRIFTTSALITATVSNYSGIWTHVAVVRLNGTTTLYVNGVSGGTTTSLNNLTSTDPVLIGGGRYGGSSPVSLNGYIDDLRITKGVARYTANFTPPASALRLR